MNYPYTSKRVGATLIDYTLTWALTILYIVNFGEEDSPQHYTINGLPALAPVAFWFIYFVITERYMGGTLGHQLLKLKVISRDNNSLSLGQVTIRRLCDALEIAWCFGLIAFLLVKSTDHHQRLGDLVAKTLVVGREDTQSAVDFDFEKS
jgi:uncharacterized RDD family membrane protein YckC